MDPTSTFETEDLQRTAVSLPLAVLVDPAGQETAVLAKALDRAGFLIRPAYSFSDAVSCLGRIPAAQLLVCPSYIGRVSWHGLKRALPPGCRVVLVLPEAGGVCNARDESVWTCFRRPCRRENLRIFACLFIEARKRIAENFRPGRTAHVRV
jgi:hypothetical protein